MPLYEHQCGYCGARRDVMIKLAELDLEKVPCMRCDNPMTRMLAAPAVRGDYAGYDCPITGKRIEGKRAHQENLAKHGCRVFEPGETQEMQRRRRADDERVEGAVDATVEQVIHEMPTRAREQLISEVSSGAEISVERKTVKG